jgi:hypothetical protein
MTGPHWFVAASGERMPVMEAIWLPRVRPCLQQLARLKMYSPITSRAEFQILLRICTEDNRFLLSNARDVK